MTDGKPPTLDYASQPTRSRQPSRYCIAAVIVLGFDIPWYVHCIGYGDPKRPQIFCGIWLLGLTLTIAAFYRQRGPMRWAHAALTLLIIDFFLIGFLPSY